MKSVKSNQADLKAEISGRFVSAREALGLSVPELAGKIGVDSQTVRDYESTKSIPGGKALAGMAELGLDVNWILTGNGTPPTEKNRASAGDRGTYGHQATPVDSILLQQVIEFFYAWLEENKDYVRINRSAHGAAIAILYRVAASSGKVVKLELEQVLRLAA